MFSTLLLDGLGPHKATRLDLPSSSTITIEGGSMAGKSTVLDALCYALWGFNRLGTALPVEQISGDRAVVELTTTRGTTIRRTLTTRRSETRAISRGGATETFASNAGLLAKLPPAIGTQPELGRLVVVPLAWRDLLNRELGRPLRDLLLTALPSGDLRAVVAEGMAGAGVSLLDADPLDLDAALKLQTAGNRTRDEASGKLSAAREGVARTKAALVDRPKLEDLEHARHVLELRDAWSASATTEATRARLFEQIAEQDRTLAEQPPKSPDTTEARAVVELAAAWDRYETARAKHEEQLRRRDEVRARREQLGERPTHDAAELQRKLDSVPRITPALKAKAETAERAKAAAAAAIKVHEDLSGIGDNCPTCRQRWNAKASAREDAAVARTAAESAAKAAIESYERNAARFADLEAEIAALQALADAGKAWDQRSRDIGPEPSVGQPPTAPARTVSAESIAQAKATIATAIEAMAESNALDNRKVVARTRQKAAERELSALPAALAGTAPTTEAVTQAEHITAQDRACTESEKALTTAVLSEEGATAALSRATSEAARREVLVRVLREAPTTIARTQTAALGNLGPVSLRFPERTNNQTPAIEVLISGRPWWLASDGELIVADLWLRAAIRRVAGLAALPIVVDRPQDWSGDWPAIPGPIWFLATTEGPIRVAGVESVKAAA